MTTIEQLKGIDKLPTIEIYRDCLIKASLKFKISIDECRTKYGKYTCKEWYNLLNN